MYLDTEIQILESISKILSRYICIAILPSPATVYTESIYARAYKTAL
ncbi:MAG: hypothetical protein PV344_06925 [Anaplasma sp.]|nr:hypothetical protein [Anaplasma sp.]